MSAPSEARVREVMRVQRCDYRSACAWLGRRGALAVAARRRRRRELTDPRRSWAWRFDFAD